MHSEGLELYIGEVEYDCVLRRGDACGQSSGCSQLIHFSYVQSSVTLTGGETPLKRVNQHGCRRLHPQGVQRVPVNNRISVPSG